jgi:hypothetical protein
VPVLAEAGSASDQEDTMRGLVTAVAVSIALLAAAGSAAGGPYSVKIELPPQWAHGQPGMIRLVGVAPPKAPYTSTVIFYGATRECLASGWAFLGKQDRSYKGYVVGANVVSRFTYVDRALNPPPPAGYHLCAYVMNSASHVTVARAEMTWK